MARLSRGQLEYAKVANAYLESKRSGWPFGYFPTGLPKNPAPVLAPLALSPAAAAAVTTPLPEFGELQVSFASAPKGCESAKDVIVPGGSAAVTGKGFAASEPVTLSLAISGEPTVALGTVAADSTGALSVTVTIPNTVPIGAMGYHRSAGCGFKQRWAFAFLVGAR